MVLASWVLNRQLMVALEALRSDLIGVDGSLQGSLVGITPLETGPGQHAELDLRHVQPTGVLGRVVKFQPPDDAPGFGGGEGLVEGAIRWVFRLSSTTPTTGASG